MKKKVKGETLIPILRPVAHNSLNFSDFRANRSFICLLILSKKFLLLILAMTHVVVLKIPTQVFHVLIYSVCPYANWLISDPSESKIKQNPFLQLCCRK